MSDNLRRYLAIRDALRQWYPASLNGHQSRHLITLAMLISGIVGSQHSHLEKVATQVPSVAKPPSRTKRFVRWVANDTITSAVYYVPFAEVLLSSLAHSPLVLVLDVAGHRARHPRRCAIAHRGYELVGRPAITSRDDVRRNRDHRLVVVRAGPWVEGHLEGGPAAARAQGPGPSTRGTRARTNCPALAAFQADCCGARLSRSWPPGRS